MSRLRTGNRRARAVLARRVYREALAFHQERVARLVRTWAGWKALRKSEKRLIARWKKRRAKVVWDRLEGELT